MTHPDDATTSHHPRVLVLALGRDPLPAAVSESAQTWEATGVAVAVVSLTPRARLTPTARQVTLLGRPVGPAAVDPSTSGSPRSAPRKVLRRLHLDPVRWVAPLLVLTSPQARRLVAGADVVLAADPASVPFGWLLSRRRDGGTVLRTVASVGRALGRPA